MPFLCCLELGKRPAFIPNTDQSLHAGIPKRVMTLGEADVFSPCNPHRGLTMEGSLLEELPVSGRVKSFIPERGSGWCIQVSTTPHI